MISLTDDSKSVLEGAHTAAWPGREQLEMLAVVSQSRACLPQLFSSGLLELLSSQLLRFAHFHLLQAPLLHPWDGFIGHIDVDSGERSWGINTCLLQIKKRQRLFSFRNLCAYSAYVRNYLVTYPAICQCFH